MDAEFKDLFSTETLETIEGVETLIDVQKRLKFLPVRTKQILYLYACGHTYEEIGALVGLTKGRICQILTKFKQIASETA